VPEFDPRPRGVAPDRAGNGLVPDPTFWGPDDRTPRRLRHHRPRLTERLGVAGVGRDGRTALAVIVASALVAAVGSVRAVRPSVTVRSAAPPTTAPARAAAGAARVVVQVVGAVTHPGVVTLPAGSRVVDALDAAGGALAAADLGQLNLAAKLRDGQQVLVPTATASPTSTTTTTTPDGGAPTPSP
jgi:competence protein ComEA